MSEREKLPNLKTNSKLIKIQEKINRVTEEILEEDEMDITGINNLTYAAATIMKQTLNEPSKNRRNVKLWKIRMQKQISSWRKALSIIRAETRTGSNNGKLNKKKRKIFQKYRVTNGGEVAQLTDTMKQKCKQKPKELEGKKKGKPSIVRIRCLKKTIKNFTETWA